MSYKSLFSARVSGFSSLLIHTLTPENRRLLAAHWSSQIVGLSALSGPCGWGISPVLPYQEVCLLNFYPLLHKIYEASTSPLMRHTKLFAGFPHDRMLNEKLRATCTVCYHSICSRLQTGHYPAIIFLDLQSRVEEAIAVACSPLGGTDAKQLENLHLHDPAEQLIRSGYLFST